MIEFFVVSVYMVHLIVSRFKGVCLFGIGKTRCQKHFRHARKFVKDVTCFNVVEY